jgi:signal transduction histidine kinase
MESGNIQLGNDTLEEVMSRMREYVTSMLEARNMEYVFRFPADYFEYKMSMETKSNLYLIFKEAINNLCKYSNVTRVEMTFITDANSMRMTIEDNGNGFLHDELIQQGGLKNMKFCTEEIGGILSVISELNKCTKVEFTLKHIS